MASVVGKQILVTGAANGIGRACALGFQQDGAQVFGADIEVPGLEKLAPFGVIPIQADCADADDVRLMIDAMLRHTQHIDVLVLNAGYGLQKPIEQMREGEFEHLVAVHLFGAVNALRAAIPIMKTRGDSRVIVMLSRGAEGDTLEIPPMRQRKPAFGH
jgi:NAD(P)-dependent dehydrogenase (short-subunit alcohol dehydrogenase family)